LAGEGAGLGDACSVGAVVEGGVVVHAPATASAKTRIPTLAPFLTGLLPIDLPINMVMQRRLAALTGTEEQIRPALGLPAHHNVAFLTSWSSAPTSHHTVSVLKHPPRCLCRFTGSDDASSHTCVS
jgi:hypothetical protein